ncbi:MAG TPA: sigma-70 family RNA polymerase sigma factor [Streptosporangiaceae bacterium]|nr:sigma-70 family RNA polymerase sigma factor [Streptosporangiaceae bacterium]
MDDDLAVWFEASRPRLRAIAYRMLGSLSDADDAVQEAWMHASSADRSDVRNLDGWLTTILARICLDMLRWRKTRREEPLDVGAAGSAPGSATPEEEAELADSVGHALLVVMDRLAPAERVSYVLHDMFAVPFGEIAAVTGRTPSAARKLASRARDRISAPTRTPGPTAAGRIVAQAFLAAARDGDLNGLLVLLDPSIALRADATASVSGTPVTLHGAANVARGARLAYQRARNAGPAIVDGRPGLVMTSAGTLAIALAFTVHDNLITEIDIIADPARLASLPITPLP